METIRVNVLGCDVRTISVIDRLMYKWPTLRMLLGMPTGTSLLRLLKSYNLGYLHKDHTLVNQQLGQLDTLYVDEELMRYLLNVLWEDVKCPFNKKAINAMMVFFAVPAPKEIKQNTTLLDLKCARTLLNGIIENLEKGASASQWTNTKHAKELLEQCMQDM